MKVLIVGIDSLIGNSVVSALVDSGIDVVGTTRRQNSKDISIFFDLSTSENEWPEWSDDIDVAFIASSITKHQICNDDPEFAEFINVKQTLKLINQLHSQGIRVIFPSTNIVLACDKMAQEVVSALAPIGTYAQGKAKVELACSELSNITIARLPKILDSGSGVVSDWKNKLSKGVKITAYTNLMISPVSLGYVTLFIIALIKNKKYGVWHLSGDSEISYYNLACKLYGADNVENLDMIDNDIITPQHPAMDCSVTEAELGISAQSINSLLEDLL